MTRPHDDRFPVNTEEKYFIARFAAAYRPTPLTPAQRARFDAQIWDRLHTSAPKRHLVSVVATLALASVIAWLTVTGWPLLLPQEKPKAGTVVVQAIRTTAWEDDLLFPLESTEAIEHDDEAMLPDDYLAIAQTFLGS